jgi:hypothetical protein
MLNRKPLGIAAIAAAAVGLSACGDGGSVPPVTSPSPSSTVTTSSPATTSTASPTPTGLPERAMTEVKSALLTLTDLPSGFEIEPASGGGDDGSASSTDPKCAPLVKLKNAQTAPGSRASAKIAFSGGQSGPMFEELIDALDSAGAVRALQASFKSAVAACQQLTVTIPGQGTSRLKVAEVSAPLEGKNTFAIRMTATGGPSNGVEVTRVMAGVMGAIVSLTFVAALPDEVDRMTEDAVRKAEGILGRSTGA